MAWRMGSLVMQCELLFSSEQVPVSTSLGKPEGSLGQHVLIECFELFCLAVSWRKIGRSSSKSSFFLHDKRKNVLS